MDAETRGASPTLLEANQRLYTLREQCRLREQQELHGQRAVAEERPFPATPVAEPTSPIIATAVAAMPTHLGWGSVAVTRVVRGAGGQGGRGAGEWKRCGEWRVGSGEEEGRTAVCGDEEARERGSRGAGENGRLGATVKHYPSLGTAALASQETAGLRLWLVCRHLDGAGRGWLEIAHLRQQVTGKDAPLKLCGWRRLRQILGEGNGRFWTWQDDRLWLHGAARVAAALGVTHFNGRPVDLPLTALTDGIGAFRAHLYAAWHSGRRASTPIARATQRHHLHVPERSQRRYCQRLNLKRQRHIAIGKPYNKERMEQRLWGQGQATFAFLDSQGALGKKNGRYVAWQLPNSYGRRHQPSRMGRQKKLQRQLTDLVNQGARGNGENAVQRHYHPNGKAAARAANNQTAYWPARQDADWQLWFSVER